MRPLLLLGLILTFAMMEPFAWPANAAPARREFRDDGAALPDAAGLEDLARTDPVGFLAACLKRYDRQVQGYRAILHKQERIDGRLRPSEEIEVAFRQKPFSVLLTWLAGPSRAARVLYVRGENDNQLLVLPAGTLAQRLVGVVRRDPLGADARQSGRYPLTQFGIRFGMERVWASWQAARDAGELHVEYLGKKRIAETGDRLCYILRRTRFAHPEEDGITAIMIFVDAETWLQVGTILKGAENRVLGDYFFRDVHLNPDFPPQTFTAAALKP